MLRLEVLAIIPPPHPRFANSKHPIHSLKSSFIIHLPSYIQLQLFSRSHIAQFSHTMSLHRCARQLIFHMAGVNHHTYRGRAAPSYDHMI